jgi:hypothetical protein
MAKVKLDMGVTLDLVSPDEMMSITRRAQVEAEERELARARGITPMKLPQLQGTPANGALLMGQGQNSCGPRDGFSWVIKRLAVTGLTAGPTPDAVRIYADSPSSQPLWEINGNVWIYTFGKFELTLLGGQTLVAASFGTFLATGTVTLSGELIEVPTVMLGKLV